MPHFISSHLVVAQREGLHAHKPQEIGGNLLALLGEHSIVQGAGVLVTSVQHQSVDASARRRRSCRVDGGDLPRHAAKTDLLAAGAVALGAELHVCRLESAHVVGGGAWQGGGLAGWAVPCGMRERPPAERLPAERRQAGNDPPGSQRALPALALRDYR